MSLDLKRKEVELMRVQCAKHELQLKIAEREDEILRLKEHVKVSEEKEISLKNEIQAIKGE